MTGLTGPDTYDIYKPADKTIKDTDGPFLKACHILGIGSNPCNMSQVLMQLWHDT